MSRPRSNELARSGHTLLGEHGRRNQITLPAAADQTGLGPVPEQNQPGHRPENDQDKPTGPPPALAVSPDAGSPRDGNGQQPQQSSDR